MNVSSRIAPVPVLQGKASPSKAESATAEEKRASSQRTDKTSSSISENMTMGEYKEYIYNKISELPVHSTQIHRSASVFISEDGFAEMKKDAAYEEWVLGKLREDFSLCNPVAAIHESFTVYQFGTKKSDYRGDSWYDGFQSGQGKQVYRARSQGNFWNTHSAKQKQILAQHDADVREKKRIANELEKQLLTQSVMGSTETMKHQNIFAAASSYDMNSVFLDTSDTSMAESITTKRFMPDGTLIVTTKNDGKIVEQSKKKPHLVPVPDALTGEVKLEPFQIVFELMA